MTRDLPPTFDEFGPEARREFLLAARNQHEILNLICDELGIDRRFEGDERIDNETLVEMYVQLSTENTVSDEA